MHPFERIRLRGSSPALPTSTTIRPHSLMQRSSTDKSSPTKSIPLSALRNGPSITHTTKKELPTVTSPRMMSPRRKLRPVPAAGTPTQLQSPTGTHDLCASPIHNTTNSVTGLNSTSGYTVSELLEAAPRTTLPWSEISLTFSLTETHICIPPGRPFVLDGFAKVTNPVLLALPIHYVLQVDQPALFAEPPFIHPVTGTLTCHPATSGLVMVAVQLQNLADVDIVTNVVHGVSSRQAFAIEIAAMSPLSSRRHPPNHTAPSPATSTDLVTSSKEGFPATGLAIGNIHTLRALPAEPASENRTLCLIRCFHWILYSLPERERRREEVGVVGGKDSIQAALLTCEHRLQGLYTFLEIEPGSEQKFIVASERDSERAATVSSALRDAAHLYAHIGLFPQSLIFFERSLRLMQLAQPDRSDLLHELRLEIADVHVQRGDWDKALAEFVSLHKLSKAKLPSTHPTIVNLTQRMEFVRMLQSGASSSGAESDAVAAHSSCRPRAAGSPTSAFFEAASQFSRNHRELAIKTCMDVVTACEAETNDPDVKLYGAVARLLMADMYFLQGRNDNALEILDLARMEGSLAGGSQWFFELSRFIRALISDGHTLSVADHAKCAQTLLGEYFGKAHPLYIAVDLYLNHSDPHTTKQCVDILESNCHSTHPMLTHLYEIAAEKFFQQRLFTDAQIHYYKALQSSTSNSVRSIRSQRLRERLCALCSLVSFSSSERNVVGRALLVQYEGFFEAMKKYYGAYAVEILPSLVDLAEMHFLFDPAVSFQTSLDLLLKALRIADTKNLIFVLGALFRPSVNLNRVQVLERNRLAAECYGGKIHEALECALILSQIGLVHEGMHDYDNARTYFDQALACFEIAQCSTHNGRVVTLDNLARVLVVQGQYGDALSVIDQCVLLLENLVPIDQHALLRVLRHKQIISHVLWRQGYGLVQHQWARQNV